MTTQYSPGVRSAFGRVLFAASRSPPWAMREHFSFVALSRDNCGQLEVPGLEGAPLLFEVGVLVVVLRRDAHARVVQHPPDGRFVKSETGQASGDGAPKVSPFVGDTEL